MSAPARAALFCTVPARDYLQFISDFVGVPIAVIGVGPRRDQVIWTQAGAGMAVSGAASAAA